MIKKILVIDDSALIHRMYRMVLARYRCQIVAARNGQDGLDKLAKKADVDLILVDINMPVMNGLEFITKVSESGVCRNIPIIIVSTEGKDEDTQKGLSLRARAYREEAVSAERTVRVDRETLSGILGLYRIRNVFRLHLRETFEKQGIASRMLF